MKGMRVIFAACCSGESHISEFVYSIVASLRASRRSVGEHKRDIVQHTHGRFFLFYLTIFGSEPVITVTPDEKDMPPVDAWTLPMPRKHPFHTRLSSTPNFSPIVMNHPALLVHGGLRGTHADQPTLTLAQAALQNREARELLRSYVEHRFLTHLWWQKCLLTFLPRDKVDALLSSPPAPPKSALNLELRRSCPLLFAPFSPPLIAANSDQKASKYRASTAPFSSYSHILSILDVGAIRSLQIAYVVTQTPQPPADDVDALVDSFIRQVHAAQPQPKPVGRTLTVVQNV